jgi:hypothetical protein
MKTFVHAYVASERVPLLRKRCAGDKQSHDHSESRDKTTRVPSMRQGYKPQSWDCIPASQTNSR